MREDPRRSSIKEAGLGKRVRESLFAAGREVRAVFAPGAGVLLAGAQPTAVPDWPV